MCYVKGGHWPPFIAIKAVRIFTTLSVKIKDFTTSLTEVGFVGN